MRDYLGTVELSYYDGGYTDTDSEDEENSDSENIVDFEAEFAELEKQSKQMGFVSGEESEEGSDSSQMRTSEANVQFFIVIAVIV